MSLSLPATPVNDFASLKTSHRHSLNPGSAPRPLHLVDANVPAHSPGPATAPLSHSFGSPLTSPRNSLSYSERNSVVKPTRHPSRRQSSISYFASHDDGRQSSRHSSRSLSVKSNRGSTEGVPVADRRSVGSEEFGASEPRARPPLTLTEKHADLLQFIAQKESKCLELRSQLAVHETELLNLKRQWERIVNRGFDRVNGLNDYSSMSSFNSPTAAGGQGASPSPSISNTRTGHAARQSNSSVSTSTTTASSTRFSQSSASSLGEDVSPVVVIPENDPEPCHDASQEGHHSRTSGARTSIDMQRSTKVHRRKSRDCSQYAGDLSSSPTSSSTAIDVMVSPSNESPASPYIETDAAAQRKHVRRQDSAFPPPSSIPGLASLSVVGGSVPPVSTWVGSVGKKWEELQKGTSFAKSQKRASVLFSDVSQSIAFALASPNSASPSQQSPGLSSVASLSLPQTPSRFSTSTVSLLDDDEDTIHGSVALGSVMTPDSTAKLAPPRLTPSPAPLSASTSDDDEWNW
ncbi:hypothetical protein SERLADRAFT_433346 [Serpula lacrymans var. lacrymans S7.9]|uniref:Uncharacterized protein n=1 Tax=Serpula lacrymans var. lacrymans (strain S7.9) TaxID=578457 RepID=F8NGG7_SERL9|nr:uncharacterized protein SERLADRAFT_433346 [Serpula lacrymans var. lacrymans S7.9]EGO29354.1 hypothetical protein SERLADRAFT_433346 [Serpula lacrymans var. lacrymans S7.9]